jgi:hypothetical protein
LVRFPAILMSLVALSCGRWHNDANRLQLSCGPDVDPERNHYVQVTGQSQTGFDAVLIHEGQVANLKRSAYGCLEVPRSTKHPAEIVIRDQNSINGRVLTWGEGWGPALVDTELAVEPALNDRQVKLLCPSDPYVTAERLPFNRVEQPTRVLTRAILQAEIYNQQGERLQQFPLKNDSSSIRLDSHWPEGTYQLKLISQDAFERNAPAFESSCQFVLDRTAPVITSSLIQEPFYDEARQIRRLAPGAQVTFQAQDASEADTFVCLKTHPASCSDEDYAPLRAITAPTEGLWDVKAYAVDKAGHQSPLLEAGFSVYHQEQVDQLLTRLTNVQLNLLLGKQPPALKAMREASAIRQQLKLEGEQAAIQWSYIENFWKLDQELNFLESIDFQQPVQRFNISTSSDQFLVQGSEGQAVLFESGRPVSELARHSGAEFSPKGLLWTAANRVLNLHENRTLLRSFSTDLSAPKLKSAQNNKDWVVIWGNKGSESLVRVYDRHTQDDSPIFKANFPKTHAADEHYSFFAGDRYLIGHNNRQLLIWDSEENFALQSYLAPEGCMVVDYAVRMDQKIYMLSHKAHNQEGVNAPPSESFCELRMIDFLNPTLSETLTERLNNVIHPRSLALTADPEQEYLALGTAVSTRLHILDLVDPTRNYGLDLSEYEVIHNVAPMSNERPLFFIGSTQRVRLLQLSSSGDMSGSIYFSGDQLGTCLPHALLQRFICYNYGRNTVEIYSSARDKTLQPTLYFPYTRFHSEDSQYLTASTLKGSVHAMYDFGTRRIQLQDEQKVVRASSILPAHVSVLSLHENGRLAVGLDNGGIGIIEDGREPLLLTAGRDGSILDIHLTSHQGVFVLRQKSDDTQVLETFISSGRELTLKNTLTLSPSQTLNKIAYSEEAGRGVLYFEGTGAEPQEAVVFGADGHEHQRIAMSVCSIEMSRQHPGFYFSRDEAIYFHDFQSGKDQLIADSLPFTPCFVLEGQELFAGASGLLFAVHSGRLIADGTKFSIGPKGTILATTSLGFKVLSTDGKKILVDLPYQRITTVKRILSAPDHPDIVLEFRENSLGSGIRRLTTDLNTIDQLLTRWGR